MIFVRMSSRLAANASRPELLARRIASLNNAGRAGSGSGGEKRTRVPWKEAGSDVVLGSVAEDVAVELLREGTFVNGGGGSSIDSKPSFITLKPSLATADERTKALAGCTLMLKEKGIVRGWRNEFYDVSPRWLTEAHCKIERAAAPIFGTKSYGVHINGFVEDKGQGAKLWVAKRR